MKTLFRRVVLVCLGIFLFAGASYSQTQINGAASGNWSSTGSWSPATVPNNSGPNTYNVTLLNSPAVTITLDISPTIDTLTLDSSSTLQTNAGTTLTTTGVTNGGTIIFNNGNTLTVNGSMTTSDYLDLEFGSKLTVTGSLTNSGQFYTNIQNKQGSGNTVTVTGTFANNSAGTTIIGFFNDTADVMNVGTLVNNGALTVGTGSTLNLTSQPNGVTDVVQGSTLDVYGTLKAGAANGLAKLTSVEGLLVVGNGQAWSDTPTGGTLTISNTGELDLEKATSLTVNSNLTNSGLLYTNVENDQGGANTLTVTGTFTNNAGATTRIGFFGDTTDVMNVATLVNNGVLEIDNGATLNLTSQPNGVTDVVQGSTLDVYGTLKAGAANGLAKLTSVEGTLVVGNGQAWSDTPTGGTLAISTTGGLDLEKATSLTVNGNLTNSGLLYTNVQNDQGGANTLTVTGAFTNNAGATTRIGYFGDTADVMNVATLVNSGNLYIDSGATLNLTSQPNGVTDVVQGSTLQVFGTLKAGAVNGLAKLTSVEGLLVVGNGQAWSDTPTGGTLTISNTGELDLEKATSLTVNGNLTNSGLLYTNVENDQGGANTLTVTGAFTNNAGATTRIGYFGDTADVMNVPTLVNNGNLYIDSGATLNLTSQPNGVTDVVQGSTLQVFGTLKAGAVNGLAKLTSVEGLLVVGNGQAWSDTPTGGTLTISNTGELDLEKATSLTVNSNLTNSGLLYTNVQNDQGGTNTLTVTGAFTNNAGATTRIGYFGDTADVMNVAMLVNNGNLYIDAGATLNLTSQPNGVTDVVAGSELDVYGTLKAGATNGLAKLTSVEGALFVGNGQTWSDTPTGGTLTISGSGSEVDLELGSNLTVNGNLTNSGQIYTNIRNQGSGKTNTLTVTGAFTNNSGATTHIGYFGDTTDVTNVGALSNAGTLTIGAGATFTVTNPGTATNTGTINVGDVNGAGTFKISGATTLTGTTGKVILSNFSGNIIGGTGTLTIVKNTISGSGNIGNGTMGLNNQGTIDANQSVPLVIQALGTVSNSLTMEATNGATLQLDAGTYTQTSAGNILASETGNLTSTVLLESGMIINGGKLTLTGTTASADLVGATPTLTLNGVTISGTGKLILPDGSTTTLMGTISNTSTIDVNGATAATTLKIGSANTSLTGTGKIIFTDSADNMITGVALNNILNNANTIEGAVNINGVGLVNTGTIETLVHQVNQLEINASSAKFNNQGTLLAATGSTLYINNTANQFLNFSGTTLTGGTYVVDGTLEFDGANIVTNAANITLSGSASKLVNQSNVNGLANFATNNGTFALAASRNFTTVGNFTNNGTLNVGSGTKFAVGTNGASNLTNYASDTLTGGTYIVAGTLQFNNEGTTMGIVTNDASITLSGATAKIEDQNSVNLLTNLATNGSGATFAIASGHNFTTVGAFTNNGTLNVGSGTTFAVGTGGMSSLTNFSGSTLTGGTYLVTGTLEFLGANIVTNAANITLTGTTSAIKDQSGNNGLMNFATNAAAGSFTLAGNRTFTTTGAFSNAGAVQINKGSTFTVASGNYTQTGGSTTVDGKLSTSASINVSGGFVYGNAGTLTGSFNLSGGTLNPGDGLNKAGDLNITGTYTESGAGILNIDLGGTTPNTKYDVLNISGAATLGGTLNVDLLTGFVPAVGQSFTVINYGSETGAFATVILPTAPPNTHWTFACDTTDCTLTLNSGPVAPGAAKNTVSASPALRVSRSAGVLASASSTHEPVAILSHVTCFAARLLGSASCGTGSVATGPSSGETHAVTSTGAGSREVHNNIMVATRTISAARRGASHESSASATAMARLYVCAYLPSSVAHTMGCN